MVSIGTTSFFVIFPTSPLEEQQSPEAEVQVSACVRHDLRGMVVYPPWSATGELAQRVAHVTNRDGVLTEICYVYAPSTQFDLGVEFPSDRMRIVLPYGPESNFSLPADSVPLLGRSKMSFAELDELVRALAPDPRAPRIAMKTNPSATPQGSVVDGIRGFIKDVFGISR